MLADLTPHQRALADYMSELSEEAYCAGWMLGLEYRLWDALVGHSNRYGHLRLTEAEVTRLRELAEQCAGWIIFDERKTWLPMVEWERRFDDWVRRGRPDAS